MSSARPKVDLDRGTAAHFEDPAYYTSAYRKRLADVCYYVELAIEAGREVLEYGCGNGRIALPLARAGLAVTGIDRSAPMLRDLRGRLRHEPESVQARLTTRRGDMRTIRLGRRYGLVLCTFNTFLHLYGRRDVERFLARVREHLPRAGHFVFDVSLPDPVELQRKPSRAYHSPRFRHPTSGELVRYAERFDYDPLDQILSVQMEFEPMSHPERAWATPLTHRQFFPEELEALLHYNGLRIERIDGDFVNEPADRESLTLIYHCSRRRSF